MCLNTLVMPSDNIFWTWVPQLDNPSHSPPTDVTSIPAVQFIFDEFAAVSLADLKRVVQELKATSCPLDTVPAGIMKEAINTLGPCLVAFINSCLSLGTVPAALKHAIVRQLSSSSVENCH